MAAEHMVKNGFSTYERETTELAGGDWAANAEENSRNAKILGSTNNTFNPAATTAISKKSETDEVSNQDPQTQNQQDGGKEP